MRSLKWTTSEAVWVGEIDDEHKEIFEAARQLQQVLSGSGSLSDIRVVLERLTGCIVGHFAHEERLMRAARCPSLRWHKQQHDAACRKVLRFTAGIEQGDCEAGRALVEYLGSWLLNHTRVADRMMAAYLRNQSRCVGKLIFRAGTKPADACGWVDADGNTFDPLTTTNEL